MDCSSAGIAFYRWTLVANGANGNISVGVGTVGGLLFGTLALLFIVPVLFVVFQYLHEKLIPKHKGLPKMNG